MCLILLSCSNGNKNQKQPEVKKKSVQAGHFPVIDLRKDYPMKEVALQDIADVEYLVLETNDTALLGRNRFVLTDEWFIAAGKQGVCFFDSNGKFSHSFNRKGEGGSDYLGIADFVVDEQAKEIFIYEATRARVQVYDFHGNFKRTLQLPSKYWATDAFYNYNADYLIACDGYRVGYYKENGSPETYADVNMSPYCKISKKTGELLPVPLAVEERINDVFNFPKGGYGVCISYEVPSMVDINSGIIIGDHSMDTTYLYSNDLLTPVAARKNRVSESGFPLIASLELMTEQYVVWHVMEKSMNFEKVSIPDPKTYLFDRYTGECSQVEFYNRDGISAKETMGMNSRLSASADQHTIPKNMMAQYYTADFLCEKFKEGQLKGKLEEVASKLTEEDNPVLMLVKFKE